ncbi:MAG: PPC domain-containing protein [Pirellulaceae bacterium]|nr:PPC domain-containing protein [Pirellulaceae bacterium]
MHAPVIYEFDSGYVLAVPTGGGAVATGGIEDGEYFTIRDSAGLVSATFEFDKDGRLTLPAGTSTAVPIKETDSSLSVARSIVQVLQSSPLRASLSLTPRLLTNSRVQVGGSRGAQLTISPGSALTLEAARPGTAPSATLQLPATLAMQLPDPLTIHIPPSGILDGETFVISDGLTSVTFEFENIFFGNGVATGNRAVAFAPTDTPEDIGRSLVNEIAGSGLFVEPTMLGGTGNVDLGGGANFVLQLPAAAPNSLTQIGLLSLQVPPGGGGDVRDGDYFTITQGTTNYLFEFEDIVTVPGGDGARRVGSILIGFNPADTQNQLAGRIVTRLNSIPGLTLNAVNAGGGVINMTPPGVVVVTLPLVPNHLFQTGPLALQSPPSGGAAVRDGDEFTISDGSTSFLFEFEDTVTVPGGNGRSLVGSILIPFSPLDTQDQIADRILAVLPTVAGLNLNAIKMTGSARVHLGSVAYDTNAGTRVALNTSASHLSQTGSSDTLVDGQRLFITDGTKVATLELDLNDSVLPGSAAVNVAAGSTPHQIASEIIFEINRAALGLSPRHEGGGLIHVGGTVLHDLDTTGVPGIAKLGTGGAVPDGQAFYVTEGAVTKRFEYDKDGTVTPGSIRIPITDAMSRDEISLATVSAMSPGVSSLGIAPRYLGDGLIDVGGNDESDVLTLSTSLEIDAAFPPLQFRVPGPGGGAGGVIDQETFTITNLVTATDYVFEFDNNGVVLPGHLAIPFQYTNSQNDVARRIITAIAGNVPGLAPVNLGGGVVNLGGDPLEFELAFEDGLPLVATGMRGTHTPRVQVVFSPSDDFTAHDVANSIVTSINGTLNLDVQASAGASRTADQRRVELVHTSAFPWDIQFTSDDGAAFALEMPQEVIKQDKDLLRIIGVSVVDPGPLGYDSVHPDDLFTVDPNTHLPGDAFSGFNSPARGQNNVFEGLYLDDFIIGFAERGEAVSNAITSANSTFVTNPDGQPLVTEGEYQLEIRRGPDLSSPLVTAALSRSIDTNDRMATGQTLLVQRGLDIADGQTFTLSDGVRHVVFEYLDTTIPDNQPEPGRLGIPFTPAEADYVVAQRVRDAINGPDAQAVLDVTAAIADGTLIGRGSPMYSTSARVNLFGPVTLVSHATDVEEVNDSIATATPTGIFGLDSAPFLGQGGIGDNENFPLRRGFDVDLFRVDLTARTTLRIDIDAFEIGSNLDAFVRIFDQNGNPVLDPFTGLPITSDDDAGPVEFRNRLDPYLEFVPQQSGTFYIGVSGFNNVAYDPARPGSGVESRTTGFYQIEISFGRSTHADYVLYDEQGDSNLFRDQGQILIFGNTVTDSSQYGIFSTAADRQGQDLDIPRMGPVRKTPKLNTEDLVPGVVIANNVLAFNGNPTTGAGGGIYFAGDTNPATEQTAAVPFGRIVNNTIYGGVPISPTPIPVDVVFTIATSSGMANDIEELRVQIDRLNSQMRAANLDAWYGLVTYPAGNPNDAPRQIQNLSDFATFTLPDSPFSTFVTAGSTEYGSQAVLEALNALDPSTNFSFRTNSSVVVIALTDEDDDSPAIDVTAALSALTDPRQPAKFFGLTLDPNSTLGGRTGGRNYRGGQRGSDCVEQHPGGVGDGHLGR